MLTVRDLFIVLFAVILGVIVSLALWHTLGGPVL